MVHHHKKEGLVQRLDGCVQGWGHSDTRLSLMVHHHKPECLVQRFDGCVQSQGHSKGSDLHGLFVNPVFFLYNWYLCKQTMCFDAY